MAKLNNCIVRFNQFRHAHQHFVPQHRPPHEKEVSFLQEFIDTTKKILVVTGAGISTESGIPDYRSELVGLYARSNHKPVQYHEFLQSRYVRQRYWARNFVGWPRFSSALPNTTHKILYQLEQTGRISYIVTQNVDNLHVKAGSRNVIDLHGTAFRVNCLKCPSTYSRNHIQDEMESLNPEFLVSTDMVRPDGDVEISFDQVNDFKPPFCNQCGGVLKPDIVFFGDNVPSAKMEAVSRGVSECSAILVLGSSLTVFSGYRFMLQAVEEQKPIVIINIGPTRADHLADVKLPVRCGDILSKVKILQ